MANLTRIPVDKSAQGIIYVTRVEPTVTRDELFDLLERYGAIHDIYDGGDGSWTVEYVDYRDAKDVLKDLDGYKLHGTRIKLSSSLDEDIVYTGKVNRKVNLVISGSFQLPGGKMATIDSTIVSVPYHL